MTLSGFDLQDAVRHAQQFDAFALGQIHDHFYPELYRYIAFRLGDLRACADIAAEVFVRLAESFKKQRQPVESFDRLIFEQADLLVSERLRQDESRSQPAAGGSTAPTAPQDDPGLDELAWLASLARRAVQALTFEEQHILALRFSGGYTLDEIALLTARNIADLRLIQANSLASLRKSMEAAS